MGGGSKPTQPSVPDPSDVAKESIQAQIDALPEILKAQQEFGPQFTQTELDLVKQFGGQFVQEQLGLQEQFAPGFGAAAREAQRAFNPEKFATQETAQRLLQSELQRPIDEVLSPSEEAQFQRQSRAATSVRGLGESGFGALEEVRGLTDLRNALKQQRLNLALSSAGLAAIPAANVVSPNVSPGGLVQNVTPQQIFGLRSDIFKGQSDIAAAQAANSGGLLGSLIGAGGSALGGLFQGAGSAGSFSALFGGGGTAAGGAEAATALASTAAAASSITYKENVTENTFDSLDIIDNLNIVNFDYKPEMKAPDKRYVGVIAEEAPDILTTKDKKYFDLYSTVGILLDANKRLLKRIEKLEEVE